MRNLFDLTAGNYHVSRMVTFAEFPKSELSFDTQVKAAGRDEWNTTIAISGSYDGPTDVIGVKDYVVTWTEDSASISEHGSATLALASGGMVHSTWVSTITPNDPKLVVLPKGGETVHVTVSPLKVTGNSMSYDWTGTVEATTAVKAN